MFFQGLFLTLICPNSQCVPVLTVVFLFNVLKLNLEHLLSIYKKQEFHQVIC